MMCKNKLLSRFLSSTELSALLRTPLYANSLYLLANFAMNALVGFVFWVIAARFFAAKDVGLATSTIAAISLLALLARAGLEISIIRFLPSSPDRGKTLINLCYTFSGVIALVIATIFIAGLNFWSPALIFLRDSYLYGIAFIVLTVVFAMFTMMDGVFIGSRRAGFVLAKSSVYSFLRLLLPFLLMGIIGGASILASWGISVIVAFIAGLFILQPKVQPGYFPAFRLTMSNIEGMARFSAANYIAQLALSLPGFLLPILVVNRLGAEPAAYFYIAWSISALLATISAITSISLFAEGSYEDSKLSKNTIRTIKFSFLLLVPALVICFVLAEKILHVFFGADYAQNSIDLLRVLIPAAIPIVITNIFIATLRVEKKLVTLIAVTLFLVMVSLGLAYYLLPLIGLVGGGVGWLAANCIIATVAGVYLLRRFRKNPSDTT